MSKMLVSTTTLEFDLMELRNRDYKPRKGNYEANPCAYVTDASIDQGVESKILR
jgi:hypothetical protein